MKPSEFCKKSIFLNPLTTTRQYTVAHFRRFFTVPKYFPIGVKFPPNIAPRTLYTVRKKKFENFQNFFCFEILKVPKLFWCKKTFFELKKIYIMKIIFVFYCRNFMRGFYVTTWQWKKLKKWSWIFFLTVHFHVFFKIFITFDIISQKV